jgi:large subunit ribosomal protein L3
MLGLLGKKLGMTQIFGDDGSQIPVTVVHAGPCAVVQKKTKETDGYNALQLGYEKANPKRLAKACRMHQEKKGLEPFVHLREFRTDAAGEFEVGQILTVGCFKVGDIVDVIGTTKGRGFQGVIKRHGKHGGPASHGSDFHRRTGSIGMRTWPARIFKNTRLPGHMGVDRVTIRNIEVVGVRPDDNVLLLRGGLPGARSGMLIVVNRAHDFEKRPELKGKKAEKQTSEEPKGTETKPETKPEQKQPEA